MIFVTVGTHEQPFDRLIKHMDELRDNGVITEEVIMQIGSSTYRPEHCTWYEFLPYGGVIENMRCARIIVTHGGPSTFIMPLQMGKIPIVVPRQKKFNEHINDHQLDFSRTVSERQGGIIVVEDIDDLEGTIADYDKLCVGSPSISLGNNKKFNIEFEKMIDDMFS